MSFLICTEFGPAWAAPVGVAMLIITALTICAKLYFRSRYFRCKHMSGEQSRRIWAPTDEFDILRDVAAVEKPTDRDMRILVLPHFRVDEGFGVGRDGFSAYLRDVVAHIQPDMIVISCDFAGVFVLQGCRALVDIMEGYWVPWAPVLGRIDPSGNGDMDAVGDVLTTGRHCMYQKGPRNLYGSGNYAVVVKRDERVIHSLFFLYSEGERENLSYDQADYLHWLGDGIQSHEGGMTNGSTVFCNIGANIFSNGGVIGIDDYGRVSRTAIATSEKEVTL